MSEIAIGQCIELGVKFRYVLKSYDGHHYKTHGIFTKFTEAYQYMKDHSACEILDFEFTTGIMWRVADTLIDKSFELDEGESYQVCRASIDGGSGCGFCPNCVN